MSETSESFVDEDMYGICRACHEIIHSSGFVQHEKDCKATRKQRMSIIGTMFEVHSGIEMNIMKGIKSERDYHIKRSTETSIKKIGNHGRHRVESTETMHRSGVGSETKHKRRKKRFQYDTIEKPMTEEERKKYEEEELIRVRLHEEERIRREVEEEEMRRRSEEEENDDKRRRRLRKQREEERKRKEEEEKRKQEEEEARRKREEEIQRRIEEAERKRRVEEERIQKEVERRKKEEEEAIQKELEFHRRVEQEKERREREEQERRERKEQERKEEEKRFESLRRKQDDLNRKTLHARTMKGNSTKDENNTETLGAMLRLKQTIEENEEREKRMQEKEKEEWERQQALIDERKTREAEMTLKLTKEKAMTMTMRRVKEKHDDADRRRIEEEEQRKEERRRQEEEEERRKQDKEERRRKREEELRKKREEELKKKREEELKKKREEEEEKRKKEEEERRKKEEEAREREEEERRRKEEEEERRRKEEEAREKEEEEARIQAAVEERLRQEKEEKRKKEDEERKKSEKEEIERLQRQAEERIWRKRELERRRKGDYDRASRGGVADGFDEYEERVIGKGMDMKLVKEEKRREEEKRLENERKKQEQEEEREREERRKKREEERNRKKGLQTMKSMILANNAASKTYNYRCSACGRVYNKEDGERHLMDYRGYNTHRNAILIAEDPSGLTSIPYDVLASKQTPIDLSKPAANNLYLCSVCGKRIEERDCRSHMAVCTPPNGFKGSRFLLVPTSGDESESPISKPEEEVVSGKLSTFEEKVPHQDGERKDIVAPPLVQLLSSSSSAGIEEEDNKSVASSVRSAFSKKSVQSVVAPKPSEPVKPIKKSPLQRSSSPSSLLGEDIDPFDTASLYSTKEAKYPIPHMLNPIQQKNPFGSEATIPQQVKATSLNSSVMKSENGGNAYKEENHEQLNPISVPPSKPITRNPFDESDETDSDSPSAAPPITRTARNPFDVSDSEEERVPAQPKTLKSIAVPPVARDAPKESKGAGDALMQARLAQKTVEIRKEKEAMESMKMRYQTSTDEYNRFLTKLTLGVTCLKWCSNGKTHKTTLKLVENRGKQYLQYDHKKALFKEKSALIDIDDVKEIRNLPGGNIFVIVYDKELKLECFSDATKQIVVPGLEVLCSKVSI